MKRILSIPSMFVLMNWAAVVGLYYFLRGEKQIWARYRSHGRNTATRAGDSRL